MKKLNVVFMGTPDIAVPTLEALSKHQSINVKYVISMPDRPSGRGYQLKSPEVIEFAKQNNLPIFQTENINKEEAFLQKLQTEQVDAIIVFAFAQFLGTKILNLPSLGCFNIHTSLLPKYRGAAPIQYALLNGDKTTGVSIQRMVKKMDAGDIALSLEVPIADDETGGQLYEKLKFKAAQAIDEFVNQLLNQQIQFTKQDETQVSFAPTLSKEQGHLDFKISTIKAIHNQIRALDPWPGTYCFLNSKRMKVFSVSPEPFSLSPGQLSVKDKMLLVGCIDGTIRLREVQLEGKKRCTDSELLNGLKADTLILA